MSKEKSELVGILRIQAYLSRSMVRDQWILWTQAQLPQFVFCKMTSRVTSNDGWNTMTENKALCKVHRWYFYQKHWKRKDSSISTATGFSTEKKVLSLPWWKWSHVIKFPAGGWGISFGEQHPNLPPHSPDHIELLMRSQAWAARWESL